MRHARLAWAPPARREVFAVLGVAALAGLACWAMWARTPAAGQPARASARVTAPAVNPYSKYNRVPATMAVELADGRQANVTAPYAQLHLCKIGQRITVVSVPVNVGDPEWTVEPGACG